MAGTRIGCGRVAAGFDHHLVKPVSFADLEDLIARSFGPDQARNV